MLIGFQISANNMTVKANSTIIHVHILKAQPICIYTFKPWHGFHCSTESRKAFSFNYFFFQGALHKNYLFYASHSSEKNSCIRKLINLNSHQIYKMAYDIYEITK